MRGPLLLLAALALFAVLDANSKLLSAGYHVSQVLAFRYAVLLALLGAARLAAPVTGSRWAGGGLATRRPGAQLLRSALMVGSGAGFFLALRELPLAEGYLVYFTEPFILLALSGLVLRERAPAAAWAWCGVGFLGVLIALSPGLSAGLSAGHPAGEGAGSPLAGYAWALAGTFCHAAIMVMNRSLRSEPGIARLLLWSSAPAMLALLPWAALEWRTPSLGDALALSANGVLAGGATVALAAAFRHATASRLAPLEFTALVFAVLADVLVWGVWPAPVVWLGAAIAVGAGLMAQRR